MNHTTEEDNSSFNVGATSCPVCHNILEMRWHQDTIPFFGEVMEISSNCSCGFKHADMIILSQSEPMRHTMTVNCEDHLCVRIIRSTSGTVRIPEWGVSIEPGPKSDAYVSNVEGVLDRIERVVHMARKWAELEEEVKRADELLGEIDAAREGKTCFTLIIEDPLGNSAIVHDNVTAEKLSPEEAEKLNTGMFIIQK